MLISLLLALTLAAPSAGRRIYLRGEGSAPIQAVTDAEGTAVPAAVLPCVNCHGYDGRGKPEGTIKPSNIRWPELTKAYTTGERSHPPYTPATLKRAVTMGIDPAGNALDRAMPRYRMSLRDAEDLVAFLQTLGVATDPGITATSVRVGVLLSPDREKAASVRDVLQAWAAASPALYGRRVELRFLDLPADAAARPAAVQAFLDREQPFALAASSLLGAETSIAKLLEETGTPTLASFAASVADDAHYTFSIFGGTREQLAAVRRHDPAAHVFSGSPSELAAYLRTTPPPVYVPAALASDALFDAPPALDGKLFVVAPMDLAPEGRAELEALSPRGAASRATQAAALASAKVLYEALKRAGRDLSRAAFIDKIEELYLYRTGVTPPLTFGPARHTGTTGAYILTVDRERRMLTGGRWVE
jgi:hypothetical protein